MILGYHDDLAADVTAKGNRIKGPLTQVIPALERVLGPRVKHAPVLELLVRFRGPIGLRSAGK